MNVLAGKKHHAEEEGNLCRVCEIRTVMEGKQHCFSFQCRRRGNGRNGFGRGPTKRAKEVSSVGDSVEVDADRMHVQTGSNAEGRLPVCVPCREDSEGSRDSSTAFAVTASGCSDDDNEFEYSSSDEDDDSLCIASSSDEMSQEWIDGVESKDLSDEDDLLVGSDDDDADDDDLDDDDCDEPGTRRVIGNEDESGSCPQSGRRVCNNCRRRELVADEVGLAEHEKLRLEFREHGRISFGRKYSSMRSSQCAGYVLLCDACTEYLILARERRAASGRSTMDKTGMWAAYIWYILRRDQTGCIVWRFFPKLMRDWWRRAVDAFSFPNDTPVVKDVTVGRSKLVKCLERGLIGEIIKVTDEEEHLCPTVLCPWGCTACPHQIGTVPFDCILQFCSPYADIRMISSKTQFRDVLSARLDFIRPLFEDYNCLILNPKWRVQPSLVFTKNGPFFATCELHNGGTRKVYFHPPRMPLYAPIPAERTDQLSPVVLKPRILKAKRRRMFNTTFETVQVRASYSGTDTVNVTDFGDFSFSSHLTERNESLAITGRLDIRSHLHHLQRNGKLSAAAVEEMQERAQKYFGGVDLDKYKEGSTFMTLGDCVSLQGQISRENCMKARIGPSDVREFPRKWPREPVWIHRSTNTGARFRDIPEFRNSTHDSRYAWVTIAMISTLSCMFVALDKEVHDPTLEWNGWCLLFASKNCLQLPFNTRTRIPGGAEHPYKREKKMSDIAAMLASTPGGGVPVFDHRHFTSLWSDCAGISCLEVDMMEEAEVVTALQQHADGMLRDGIDANEGRAIVCTRSGTGQSFGVANGLPDSFTHRRQTNSGVVDTVLHLRMVVLLPEQHSAVSSWDGTVVARHDPREFGHWWYQRRRGKMTALSSLDELQGMENWRVAVYVTDTRQQVAHLRNQYLEYIGGQNKMFCAEHDVPLITAAPEKIRRRKHCYCTVVGSVCGKKVSLCCPVPGCRCWICSDCYKSSGSSGERVDHAPCASADDEGNEGGAEDEDVPTRNADAENSDSEFDRGPGVSQQIPLHIDELLVVEPELAEDDLEVYNEQPDNAEGPEIPTTIAGNRPFRIRAKISGNSPHEIPGHIAMNGCGTLLVRGHGKISGNIVQQNFLQKAAAMTEGVTVPLVYLEGALFPSVFWGASRDHASIYGAIPSCLLAQPSTVSSYGVASLRDHTRTRVTSADSLTGTDSRYWSFMFDALANVALNSRHSRVVMNRGFVESQGPSGLAASDPESSSLISDFIDSRRIVRNLSATEKDYPFTLFVTITCNQMRQFGIRLYTRWLKDKVNWISGYYHCENLTPEVEDEIENQLYQAASSLLLRNWLEVRKILIHYLVNSLEGREGIGHILKLFNRDEYQDAEGNLPHCHILMALAEDITTEEGLAFVENLVRGSSAEIVRDDEVGRLIDMGLLESEEELIQLREEARCYLSHKCSERCQRMLMDGTLVCRVKDNYSSSPDPLKHVHVVYDPGHTAAAVELMADLGLCEVPPEDNAERFKALVSVLEARKHFPPSVMGDGKFSAANGTLFVICRCNTNIQICHTFATSRYLCKYVGKIDENNAVWLAVDSGDERAISAEKIFLHNTKIEGSARAEKKQLEKRRDSKGNFRARSMTIFEMLQRILGVPSTLTNIEYVNVATCPMEERRGMEKDPLVETRINPMLRGTNRPEVTCLADLHSDVIESISCRSSLPEWRQYDATQQLVIRDSMFSTVTIDRVTVFSVRPCELVGTFDTLLTYFKFFTRSKRSIPGGIYGFYIDSNLEDSSWIDGLGHEVKIRYRAIDAAVEHLDGLLAIGTSFRREVSRLFKRIKVLKDAAVAANRRVPCDNRDAKFFRRFVDFESHNDGNPMAPRTLPTVVFSDVKPSNPTKFLVHLLLSMGSFKTECELLRQPDMLSSFVHAKILAPRGSPGFEESVNNLIRRYIVEQLAYAPIRTKTLDYYATEAARVLRQVFVDEDLRITDTPGVLFTSLQEECSENVEAKLLEMKQTVVDACFRSLSWLVEASPGFPAKEELTNGTVTKSNPHPWDGQLVQNTNRGQGEASHVEHLRCAQVISNVVTKYSNASDHFIKSLLILGGPGCGKTFEMMYGVLQCLCKGLLVMTTALLSARARTLGGIHFHRLFCVRKGRTPQQIAEAAAIAVMKNPILYAFFLRLDGLAIDEFGQLSAELFSAFEIFMRIIRGVNTFFGGVILFGSIDDAQIRTFTGTPVLLSPHILTSFDICTLEHSVRSANDAHHRLINDYCRMPKSRLLENNGELLNQFLSLVSEHCSFVDDWDSPLIPKNAIRIFGKKKPVRASEKKFRQEQIQRCTRLNLPFAVRQSVDTQIANESHSNWQPASAVATTQLNHKVKEPRELLFFEFAVYEFTCNKPGHFSQTQLAVVCDVPAAETVNAFAPVEVIAAPTGLRFIDFQITSRQQLIDMGWEALWIIPQQQHTQRLKQGIRGRRQQYPLKPNVASTLHAAMGSEVGAVATQLSRDDKDFCLWEKGQLVVLMSRTECAKNVFFVGNKEENLLAIREIVLMTSQYDEYIRHLLQVLCAKTGPNWEPPVVHLNYHILRPKDVPLPPGGMGVAYLLVSTVDLVTTYIGQTLDYVGERLRKHNGGYGARQTWDLRYRPWGLLACVVGFDGSQELLLAFERDWKTARHSAVQRNHGSITPNQVANLALKVMDYALYRDKGLRLVINGNVDNESAS